MSKSATAEGIVKGNSRGREDLAVREQSEVEDLS